MPIDPEKLVEAYRMMLQQQVGPSQEEIAHLQRLGTTGLMRNNAPAPSGFGTYNMPNTSTSNDPRTDRYNQLVNEGVYSEEEARQIANSQNFSETDERTDFGTDYLAYMEAINKRDGNNSNIDKDGTLRGDKSKYQGEEGDLMSLLQNGLPFMGGSRDLATNAFDIGRYAGMEKGTPGRGLGIAASAGDMLFGAARGITSGIGYSKRNQYIEDWYRQQQNKRTYTPVSQTQNNNISGGLSQGENGGEMGDNLDFIPTDPKNRRERAGFTLRKNQYGDVNWFEEGEKQMQEAYEQKYGSEDYSRLLVPQERGFMDSAKLAMKLNKKTREEDLPYQRLKLNAFVVRDEDVPDLQAFDKGGEYGDHNKDLTGKPIASLTPQEREDVENMYLRFSGRPMPKDAYLTEQMYEQFKTTGQVYGYETPTEDKVMADGQANIPPKSVDKVAYMIQDSRDPTAKSKWVDRATFEKYQGPKTTMKLSDEGEPIKGGTVGEYYKNYVKTFEDGGSYDISNIQEGQMITFEYGGKMYSGKVKKTRNGQIYI